MAEVHDEDVDEASRAVCATLEAVEASAEQVAQQQAQQHRWTATAARDWYTDHPLHDASRQIRLLYIQDGTGDAPVVAALYVVSLKTAFRYAALSYHWGPPVFDQAITLNGAPFFITLSLHAALQQLRNHYRWVWIDQVCINQQDVAERSTQVLAMQRIYSQADEVAMYLGDEGPDTKFFLQWLNELRRAVLGEKASASFNDEPFQSEHEVTAVTTPWTVTGRAKTGAIDFVEQPYLYRGWVIQEASLARFATCFCGGLSFNFRLLDPLAAWFRGHQLRRPDWPSSEPPASLSRTERPPSANLLDLVYQYREVGPRSLLWYLEFTNGYELRDPRDRFYCLLGLIQDPDSYPKPDYSKMEAEVYREYAARLLCPPDELGVLWNADGSASRPSWVPRWTQARLSLRTRNEYVGVDLEPPEVCLDAGIVTIAAVHIDMIAAVPPHSVQKYWGRQRDVRTWMQSCLTLLQQLPQFGNADGEVLCETLWCLIVDGHPQAFAAYEGTMRQMSTAFMASLTDDEDQWPPERDDLDPQLRRQLRILAGLLQLHEEGHTLLLTQGDRYGWGPGTARAGDAVVRFKGASFLSVVRQEPDGFFLVGHVRFPYDEDREIILRQDQEFVQINLV